PFHKQLFKVKGFSLLQNSSIFGGADISALITSSSDGVNGETFSSLPGLKSMRNVKTSCLGLFCSLKTTPVKASVSIR
ncbi:hypothetical protein, partial [uncultured Pontibacter sp.]|uniref:hypothetical protein n=1 Tax=uncultured Pontibacter sp. TaxID=453356 RepID=UPI002605F9B9